MNSPDRKIDLKTIDDPFDRPSVDVVRFAMYRDILEPMPDIPLPFGYRLEAWYEPLLPAFAAATAVSFSDSQDVEVYPNLGSREGCHTLIESISAREDFISGASWLVFNQREPCGLILSRRLENENSGLIQIVGVSPRHRRMKIGSIIVNKAMWAFRDRKMDKAVVFVNRANRSVVRFFRALEFRVHSSREYI